MAKKQKMSRPPPMIVFAVVLSAFLFCTKPSAKCQEYLSDPGGGPTSADDPDQSQEEQQQSQSLQSILSKLIPSVWAEKPKREPATASTATYATSSSQRPSQPIALGANGYTNIAAGGGSGNNIIGDQFPTPQLLSAATKQAYVTSSDRDLGAAASSNVNLDNTHWSSSSTSTTSTSGHNKPPEPYDNPAEAHPTNLGWHNNRYFAPSLQTPARQVISATSNRLFYPPQSPSSSVSNQDQQQQASHQGPAAFSATSPLHYHLPAAPTAAAWPQSISYAANDAFYPQFYHHHQQHLQQHQPIYGPSLPAYHHSNLLALPSSGGPHQLMGQSHQVDGSTGSSSPMSSMGSSLLASLANNKADISNLIKLLPLIAQTVSILPRVLNPAANELDTPSRTQLEPGGSQKLPNSGDVAPPASPALGSQAAAQLIKSIGSLALASATSQQQQPMSMLSASGEGGQAMSGLVSRWPAGASLIGSMLRQAAASWWPTIVARAQELQTPSLDKSRPRNRDRAGQAPESGQSLTTPTSSNKLSSASQAPPPK